MLVVKNKQDGTLSSLPTSITDKQKKSRTKPTTWDEPELLEFEDTIMSVTIFLMLGMFFSMKRAK